MGDFEMVAHSRPSYLRISAGNRIAQNQMASIFPGGNIGKGMLHADALRHACAREQLAHAVQQSVVTGASQRAMKV
jgi:hypothetical protein